MAKKWKEYGIDVIWKNYTIMLSRPKDMAAFNHKATASYIDSSCSVNFPTCEFLLQFDSSLSPNELTRKELLE